ncbi:hypothetical protein ACLOJK_012994 [Asimina triloba]
MDRGGERSRAEDEKEMLPPALRQADGRGPRIADESVPTVPADDEAENPSVRPMYRKWDLQILSMQSKPFI